MIIFDFDQTLVDTSPVEELRRQRKWKSVMARAEDLLVYPGISDILGTLKDKGHTLAIVTKSPNMVPIWFKRRYGWPIEIILGYHDVSQQKPHPEGILKAIRLAGATAAETFHVGDQSQDTQAARAAGVQAIGVTWGLRNDEELRASSPDLIFSDVAELARYLTR